MGLGQRAVDQQLVVDLHLIGHAQAVRHLDDVDAVDEGLVVLVVAEGVPFRFVGVGQQDAVERNRAQPLGTVVVAFLGGRQQRMQHLDRRLEHFDEFHQALVRAAQRTRVAVGVGIVLREFLELADIDLADQCGNVLVVLVARLGLGHGDLVENRRVQLDHAELADVAAEFLQALGRPRRHDRVEIAPRDAVILFENLRILSGVEQPQRRLEHRRTLDRIERYALHELLEFFGQRGLAAAYRAEEVEDLLLLLQALRGVAEVGNDLVDAVFHAVEVLERGVTADDLVGEGPATAAGRWRCQPARARQWPSAAARRRWRRSSGPACTDRGIPAASILPGGSLRIVVGSD
ncbi:hypothetical protein SSTU70S_02974 [Stutzerimonas stutzeri]